MENLHLSTSNILRVGGDDAAEDSISKKLQREVSSLTFGTVEGMLNRTKEYCKDPILLAEGIAAPALVSAGLAAMTSAGGRLGAIASSSVRVLSFLAGADIGNRVWNISEAISDNWDNPANYRQNRDKIGSYLGAGIVDYTLAIRSATHGMQIVNHLNEIHALPVNGFASRIGGNRMEPMSGLELSISEESTARTLEKLHHVVVIPPLAVQINGYEQKK